MLVCGLAWTRPLTARPRSQVAQLVYVAVGCVVLYMVKVLLTVRASLVPRPLPATEGLHCAQTLILVASATLGIVCLSRWLVYNGTVGARRFDRCLEAAAQFALRSLFRGADASRSSDALPRDRRPPDANERPRHGCH